MIIEQRTPMTDAIFTDSAETPDIVNALAVSPDFQRDGVCFAAQNSGLYRSDNGGLTWRFLYDSLALDTPLITTAVALSPAFGTDHALFAGAHGGVLRSTDGGATWQVVMLPSPPPLVTALAVSPNFVADGVVFAGTLEDGMFRSDDCGSSWAAWNFGLLDLNVLSMMISPDFVHDETLFVGTGSGLFRSRNGGRAWREVELPVEFTAVLSIAAIWQAGGLSTLFVGTEDSGLFASDDLGRTWRRLGDDALIGAVNSIIPAADASTSALLVLLDDRLAVSRDSGKSWTPWQTTGSADYDVASVAAPDGLEPAAPVLVGLINGGVVRLMSGVAHAARPA